MENPDGIGDDEITPNLEFPDQEFKPSRHEGAQSDEVQVGDVQTRTSNEGLIVRGSTATYPKPKEAKTAQERADDLADTVRNFRIAHAGDGLLRGNFGNLIDQFKDLQHQMENLQRSVDQFTLEGDGLNVSGSFDKGYTVERQDPCPPPQESADG